MHKLSCLLSCIWHELFLLILLMVLYGSASTGIPIPQSQHRSQESAVTAKGQPLPARPSRVEAVPAPGMSAQLAATERSLCNARRWVEARDRHDGLYQQQDPLRCCRLSYAF